MYEVRDAVAYDQELFSYVLEQLSEQFVIQQLQTWYVFSLRNGNRVRLAVVRYVELVAEIQLLTRVIDFQQRASDQDLFFEVLVLE